MKYYDPNQVISEGKRLYSSAYPEYPQGNFLIAVCDRGLWKVAGEVSNKHDYDEMYSVYAQGMFLSFDLYVCDSEPK